VIKFLKSIFYVFVWLVMFLGTSIVLIVVSIIAILRGRQEQYFVQKPIFDPGDFKK